MEATDHDDKEQEDLEQLSEGKNGKWRLWRDADDKRYLQQYQDHYWFNPEPLDLTNVIVTEQGIVLHRKQRAYTLGQQQFYVPLDEAHAIKDHLNPTYVTVASRFWEMSLAAEILCAERPRR
jgi:hypothetical protein